ncbi:hypothetical protein PoB_006951000 [Plakobranchus ocellatus]|uniref:Uncharacterized protein n=1 Tax=Plakobranchus ocellatus TaxID=259542 RepID=A0AAV4DG61_9GAST|nr:hypothetical protein PoB_006951000 [Plakobranchus ocellatus]
MDSVFRMTFVTFLVLLFAGSSVAVFVLKSGRCPKITGQTKFDRSRACTITRNTASDETPTGDGPVAAESLAVVLAAMMTATAVCEVVTRLGGCDSMESVKDLKFGDELSTEQRRELEEFAGCFSLFSTTAQVRQHWRRMALR